MLKRIIATVLAFVTIIGLLPMIPANMEAEAAGVTVLLWPLPKAYTTITSGYGNRNNPVTGEYEGHAAIDISAPKNTPIYSVYDGKVTNIVENHSSAGNMVMIYHSDLGIYSRYYHLNSFNVSKGDTVKCGDIIGYVGTTGNSTGYHLDYGLCRKTNGYGWPDKSTAIDPTPGAVYSYTYKAADAGTTNITTTSITVGDYQIKNKSTGTYLTVVSSKDADNQNINVAKNTSASGQRFYIYSYSGSYGIRPHCSSSSQRVVNVSTPETVSSGCNVMLWERTNHSSQLWKFEKLSTGEYVIRSTNNLNCALTASDGNVIVKTYSGSNTQKWILEPLTYSVKFDANGGSGAPSSQTKKYGTTLTLSSTKPTRDGYSFVEWNTAADGSGTAYAAGASYTANKAVTLYAQWKENIKYYYLDLNGKVNGTNQGNISGIGTADIYVNGVNAATGVADFYKAYPAGSTYTIKNIKAKTGYVYTGPATVTGTINSYTGIYLEFKQASYYLDLNGKVNGTNQGNISGIGTADIYVNGTNVAAGVADFYRAYPAGSTYTIKNIKAKTGYVYTGPSTVTGTIGSYTGVYLEFKKATTYYLDLNGKVGGTSQGNINNIGTADIYVNGTKVATGVSDFYRAYPAGSTYTIKNIKAKSGYTYTGPSTVTGTIGSYTGVYLDFKKASATYYLDLNGKVGGTSQGNINNIGTADIYVNGTKVATGVSDFYKAYPAGSTYTIKNIKAKSGYTYTGPATVTGTIGSYTGVYLEFKKAASTTYYLDLNGKINGTSQGHFNGMGSADVYINGVKVATGVSDFYKAYPAGTTYTITNIKAKTGYTYTGPSKITGTISGYTGIYLEFKG